MTIIVSISQFRDHIADYIAKAKEGYTVILKDEKKDQQIAQLVGKKKFNPHTFGRALKAVAGVFTATSHPEWRTKRNVSTWVTRERQASDRRF